MKRFQVFLLAFCAFAFASCSDISSSSDSSDETSTSSSTETKTQTTQTKSSPATTTTASTAESWAYNESSPIYEISSDVSSLTVSGDLDGKSVYLVKANKTSSTISASSERTITKISNISDSNGISDFSLETENADSGKRPKLRNFIPPEDVGKTVLNGKKSNSSSRSVSSSSTSSISTATQISAEVDSTTKSIYVDNDTELSTFTSKTATLRATGEYCYVWVVDDYYTSESASGSKVDSSTAETFASKFDEIYPAIRNVFGEESDYLINYDTSITSYDASLAMESYSDTGTMVNIVIYDIGADSELDSSSQCGVVGYFYSKDYVYPSSSVSKNSVINYSNKGKYFYVDSSYAVSYFDTVISTLAHEFQHMINFNVKNILQNLSPSTSYNEMLSMLCEDMMQEMLDIDDDDSPKARLQGFNAYYFLSGLSEYNSSYAVVSYADSYALGAWLSRQYGGAALVQTIMQNDSVDNDSIADAVNSLNGTDYDFDDLFKQFLLAITGNETYTLNQDAEESLSYENGNESYTYPMTAVDLWNEDYSITSSGLSDYSSVQSSLSAAKYSSYDWCGPYLFSKSYSYALRPDYGFTLHGIEEISSSTSDSSKTIERTYTFSESGSSSLAMYLIIQ